MTSLYLLSLRQLATVRRLLVLVVLGALPIFVSALLSATGDSDAALVDGVLLAGVITAAILPLVTLAVATAAFGNELEDNTLSNLTLSPYPRWKIVLPKLAAALTIGVPILVVSSVVAVLIALEGDAASAAAAGLGVLIGVCAYNAVFLWAGLMTTRALWYGLLYVFLWEGLFASFVDGVKYLSIGQYTLSLVHTFDDSLLSDPGLNLVEGQFAIAGAIAVTLVFTALSVRRLRYMDVP